MSSSIGAADPAATTLPRRAASPDRLLPYIGRKLPPVVPPAIARVADVAAEQDTTGPAPGSSTAAANQLSPHAAHGTADQRLRDRYPVVDTLATRIGSKTRSPMKTASAA